MDSAYFHVEHTESGPVTRGSPTYFRGHRIDRPDRDESDGIFAEWAWDGTTLRVRGCRYGSIPLFYYVLPREVCVSDCLALLLAQGAPTDLDDAAIATFLRIGCYFGDDTAFRAIRRVPPNVSFEWRDGELEISGRFTIPALRQTTRRSAIDDFIAAFRHAIQRRLSCTDDFVLPLSGGRDSRHILLELLRQGIKPRLCITARYIAPRPDEDVRIATLLTQRLGLQHRVLPQGDSRLEAELEKNRYTDFCTLDHTWTLPIRRFCVGHVNAVYDGLGGDQLCGRAAPMNFTRENLDHYDAGRFDILSSTTFDSIDEYIIALLLRPDMYKRFNHDLARIRIREELIKHASAPNPVISFHFWNRGRGTIATYSFGVLRELQHVLCPFLDHDVFDLLATLPPRLLLDTQFQSEAIHKAYPEYADVPFEDKSVTRKVSHAYYRRFAWELLYFVGRRWKSRFINPAFLMPRLARWYVSRQPQNLTWFRPDLAVYLLQLEALINDPRGMGEAEAL